MKIFLLEICSWALSSTLAIPNQSISTQFQKMAVFLNFKFELKLNLEFIKFSNSFEFLKNISDILRKI